MIQDCLVCNFSLLLACCLFVSQIYFSNGQTACTITLTTFFYQGLANVYFPAQ